MNNTLLEQAKSQINLLEYIQRVTNSKAKKVGKTYFINPCPFCNKYDHFSVDIEKNLFNSFSECCKGGSIVDFIMQYDGLSITDAINKVIDIAGINESNIKANIIKTKETKLLSTNIALFNDRLNFNDLIGTLHVNAGQTDYYKNRGLTDKTITKYKLGYAEDGLNYAIRQSTLLKEKECQNYQAYKYFLPIFNEGNDCDYFISRLDDNAVPEGIKLNKTHNLKDYPAKILNERYLRSGSISDDTILIVEGYFDALSLEELDYKAIALNSVANANILINKIKDNIDSIYSKSFILIPDNDIAGEELQEKLLSAFRDAGLNLEICKLTSNYKDANDFLKHDRQGLELYISQFLNDLKCTDYNSSYMDTFLKEIERSINTQVISTGFKGLDDAMGGLYPGLYTIGAISSLGKTTLILQIADYIAKNGTDVLYFSLEMGKNELIRKSLSREMFIINPSKAVTSREIQQGKYDNDMFDLALTAYQNISNNIAMIEGESDCSVQQIRDKVKKNLNTRKKAPVVIVDYLQILKPFAKNMSDKQAVDYNISALKKISRDYCIPVLVISSLNRAGYTSSIGYESFKETGDIEYASDVVMGLQLKGIDTIASCKIETEKRNKINDLKAKYPRDIELVIIKQRDGLAYAKQDFKYYAKYNLFVESNR